MSIRKLWLILLLSSLVAGCAEKTMSEKQLARPLPAVAKDVDWLNHGNDIGEARFSSLADINDGNVGELSLAWHFDYPTDRGMEVTPIERDGIIYTTSSWNMAYAHDVLSGKLLWMYDPEVPREWAVHACCDVVNRGLALQGNSIFFGTLDGRLVSLNASSGEFQWEVQTTDKTLPYTITGAPRVVKDKVIIGNGGAEYGVRGYVSAYSTSNGEMAWRFYTVPGNPELPFEKPAMKRAAETWGGGPWWEIGGGGTVWDSMAYDEELNLLYVGVGNGSPWNREIRSPDGGDNLYLSSIVALNPDDGSYVWHYQTTPGDSWDYTATQHMILAELEIAGVERQVIMQAPKNGFFYVLDRKTGEFISAEAYGAVTWASHIDPKTGRPVETEGARYEDSPIPTFPAPYGAHNWHPMSYSPDAGLVYIPAQDIPHVYGTDENFVHRPGFWNTGTDARLALLPSDPVQRQGVIDMVKGHISAWDPVAQKERWRVVHEGPWNGGMLSTAGNLLFQGNAEGQLVAYSADKGAPLWQFDAQTGIVAPPVTFRRNGEQYVAVAAGWGGTFALTSGEEDNSGPRPNRSRLLVFKLGGQDALPAVAAGPAKLTFTPSPQNATQAQVERGLELFHTYCFVCHGAEAIAGGTPPDLRAISQETRALWDGIVLGGLHWNKGMVGFSKALSKDDSDNILHYVNARAHFALKKD
ncbi:MAG: PQQ-dependent dehydrogenase (methanol/ethanol family) [Halioglobus sp.]|jgi:PQQ-dependent dehydrogenase (methanol/ethanol family)